MNGSLTALKISVDIANKEFAWCDAELLKASRDMGFGDKWKDALEKVKQTYVPPG
jgi:hypothetical protein